MDTSVESPWRRRATPRARPLAPGARAMWRALSKPSPRKRRSMFTAARKSEETLRCFCAVRSIFLNGLVSVPGAPRVGDARRRSATTMTASTSAVRPARPSDVAAIESFVERYALGWPAVRFLALADRPAPRISRIPPPRPPLTRPPSHRPTPAGPPRVACTARSTSAASWSAPPSRSSRRREAPSWLSSP